MRPSRMKGVAQRRLAHVLWGSERVAFEVVVDERPMRVDEHAGRECGAFVVVVEVPAVGCAWTVSGGSQWLGRYHVHALASRAPPPEAVHT